MKAKAGKMRSMLVWSGGKDPWAGGVRRGTCTWEKRGGDRWECISGSKLVRWMVGCADPKEARSKLDAMGMGFEWIESKNIASLKEIANRRADQDPITIEDRNVMRDKWQL